MKRIIAMFVIFSFFTISCSQGEGGSQDSKTNSQEDSPLTIEQKDQAPETAENPNENVKVDLTVETIGETMTEMEYVPERLEVPRGAMVNLTLKNTAKSEAMIHNFVVINFGKQSQVTEAALAAGSEKEYIPDNPNIVAATSLAQPGESVEVSFRAPVRAGNYQFICTYPGHTAMKGVLIVQ